MREMFALAAKDLKILFRVKPALFFTVGWPITIAVLFGAIFGGGGGKITRLPIAVVDEDQTEQSRAFVAQLSSREGMDAVQVDRNEASGLVQRGKRTAAVVLTKGFGAARQRMFVGAPPAIDLLVDPSHKAEAGMLEGLLYEQAAQSMQTMMTDPKAARKMVREALTNVDKVPGAELPDKPAVARFLGELDRFLDSQTVANAMTNGDPATPTNGAANGAPAASRLPSGGGGFKPVDITVHNIGAIDQGGPHSGYEVSFVQGLTWAIFGCIMGFSMSIVNERTQGTFTRLRMAPLTDMQVLGGKALGCFIMLLLMQSVLIALGVLAFGVRVQSPGLMALIIFCSGIAFVGIMMLVAALGRTEEGTRGAGFAVLMPMNLFGGGMIPLMIMPVWMTSVSNFSPVKWAVIGVEGAMWRGFTLADMLLPCGILLGVGVVAFALGLRNLKRIGFAA
jgi:ABC-2 type transport system permease protein